MYSICQNCQDDGLSLVISNEWNVARSKFLKTNAVFRGHLAKLNDYKICFAHWFDFYVLYTVKETLPNGTIVEITKHDYTDTLDQLEVMWGFETR